MWAIRFLNGKLRGQEIPLQEGTYLLGRGEDCQISIPDAGISKKHAELEVDEEGVFIQDLKSSNGTFLNGVKIQESGIQNKDKVSLSQTTFDIIQAQAPSPIAWHPNAGQVPPSPPSAPYAGAGGPIPYPHQQAMPAPYANNPSVLPQPGQEVAPQAEENKEPPKLTLKNWFINYINTVVLPGVYKIPALAEFKWVVGGFLLFFVVMMTTLSVVPLIQILNASVAQESMNHAESIARTLARMNYSAIKTHIYSSADVDYALKRPGVSNSFIINAVNGKIIAPAEKAHTYPSMPFVHEGRKTGNVFVKKIDPNTVGAMAPISFFNKKTNMESASAYSVVIYDIGALASNNKRVISLLAQNCFIALVLGLLVFFFLYKIIEFPIVSLNKQLSQALQDDSVSVEVDYDFAPLQNLSSNINSALTRISTAQESKNTSDCDRMTEMNHIIEMIGYPTLGIDMESQKITGASAHFEEETGVSVERILNFCVQDIDDQSLKLNLSELLEKVQQHPHEIASDSLEFSGTEFQLSAKGIYGTDGLAYTVISFIPTSQEQEEAS